MSKYAIQRVDKHHVQSIKDDDVISLLETSNQYFADMYGQIQVEMGSTKGPIYHVAFAEYHLVQHGSVIVTKGPWDQNIAEKSLTVLMGMIALNREALTRAASPDEPLTGPIIFAEEKTNGTIDLRKAILFPADVCEKCDEVVLHTKMEDHLRTTGCMTSSLDKSLDVRGLVKIDDEDEEEILKAKSLKIEYHPASYSIYAPKWVEGAISSFKKNKLGYAAMSLHEYLERLAGPN